MSNSIFRPLKTQMPDRCLVKKKFGKGIFPGRRDKISPSNDFYPIEWNVVLVARPVNTLLYERAFVLTIDSSAPAGVFLWKVLAYAHHIHACQLPDFLRQHILLLPRQSWIYLKIYDGVPFETKILVEHKTDLVVNNQRSDDKKQRHRKLKYDQCLANIVFSIAFIDTLVFQARRRLVRR